MAVSNSGASAVSREVEMRILLPSGGSQAIPSQLDYRVEDPFAVRATFGSAGASVTWVFARDLLQEGTVRPSGDGDIRVLPVQRDGSPLVRLELSSPDGRAVIEAPLPAIQEFLAESFNALPAGQEWRHLYFDQELADLLKDDFA